MKIIYAASCILPLVLSALMWRDHVKAVVMRGVAEDLLNKSEAQRDHERQYTYRLSQILSEREQAKQLSQ